MEENSNKPNDLKLYEDPAAIEAFIDTPGKTGWYIISFKKFDVYGIERITWNWSWWAFFFDGWYLLYRKCYKEGIIVLLSVTFLTILVPQITLILKILCGGFLVFGVYKNFKIRTAEVESITQDYNQQLKILRDLGGVNKIIVYLFIGFWAIIFFIFFLGLMFASVSNY